MVPTTIAAVPGSTDLSTDGPLSVAALDRWREDGFVVVKGLLTRVLVGAMADRATELARWHAEGTELPSGHVIGTDGEADRGDDGGGGGASLVMVHDGDPVFAPAARHPALADAVSQLLGPDIDCFLSQYHIKGPAAPGRPWHQAGAYFPFEPDRQVGAWIAVTESRLENGPLWVLPGSHTESIHEHVATTRPGAPFGSAEIVGHDLTGAIPVPLGPGDVVLFDSHLFHRSSDNESAEAQAVMTYHYACAGTDDGSAEALAAGSSALSALPDDVVAAAGSGGSLYDAWLPVRRDGTSVLT